MIQHLSSGEKWQVPQIGDQCRPQYNPLYRDPPKKVSLTRETLNCGFREALLASWALRPLDDVSEGALRELPGLRQASQKATDL